MKNLYYIDLFCGAGGVSTGIIRAKSKVIACINHDPLAIDSHKRNHKNVLHFTEDIRHFNVNHLGRLVRNIRRHDPNALICLWASLECTHFSKAKGGESRDADSRTLAEHLYRYIAAINPDYIDIENVIEFMSWGPLRIACDKSHKDRSDLKMRKGKEAEDNPYHWIPASKQKGKDYMSWTNHICDQYQYQYDHRIFNAADFGARTSRVRYFGQFKKRHLPFTWPEATHSKKPVGGGLFGPKLRKWKAVKPALDLNDKGRSIFGRKKDLSPNTYERLYAGLIKHVGTGKEPEFISKYLSNPMGGTSNPVDLNDPAPTISTQNRLAVVQPEFVMKYFSGRPNGKVKSTNEPLGTISSFGGGALVQVQNSEFISKYFSGNQDHSQSIDRPAGTITTKDHHSVVFISKYHGNGDNIVDAEKNPAGAIVAADVMAMVWLDKQYGGKDNHVGVDRPCGTILSNDKHSKVEAILVNNYSGGGQHGSIDSPAGSITTVPKANIVSLEPIRYLFNPQFSSKGSSIDNPCFTLIARMDKAPPSLVETEPIIEGYGIVVYDEDIEIVKKIKLFMATYGIADIKMRMLRVPELLKIQGFGAQYKLSGNQTDQKRFIGNSVPPELVKHMVSARTVAIAEYVTKLKKVA